ncbi:hypothetical protein MtrunA17_Chr1g0147281 [Medicago truncatula]|uniref:Transmembrane protein n=1 Tax=Medicago truncatula TaxID=3880 RepID=A0A396JEZ1_MEDTR|nr:hypothetical protein MtrunA17_Chr1g0147281 [Medicago truncatula]
MEFHLFHIITSLMLVLVGTNAAIFPPQYYWKSMLPNSSMPKAITDLLNPGQHHTLKLMSMYIYIQFYFHMFNFNLYQQNWEQ